MDLLSAEVHKLYNDRWESFVSYLDPTLGNLWRVSKSLKNSPRNAIRPLHGSSGLVYGEEEKAEVFADSLFDTCQSVDTDLSDDYYVDIEVAVDKFLSSYPEHDPFPPFTVDETIQAISQLKNNSSQLPVLIP